MQCFLSNAKKKCAYTCAFHTAIAPTSLPHSTCPTALSPLPFLWCPCPCPALALPVPCPCLIYLYRLLEGNFGPKVILPETPIRCPYLGLISKKALYTTIMSDLSKMPKNDRSRYQLWTLDPDSVPHTKTVQIFRIFPCCASILEWIKPKKRIISSKM